MSKKGQAAIEFLMTYGWAILAAIIAIGVLAYFGVFSPGKYVTGSAVVNPPFYANAWNVKAGAVGAAVVNLEIKNNGGEDYILQFVGVTNCGTNNAILGTTITTGATLSVPVTCAGALVAGDSFKGDVTINYRKSGGSTTDLTSTGTIAEKVTA